MRLWIVPQGDHNRSRRLLPGSGSPRLLAGGAGIPNVDPRVPSRAPWFEPILSTNVSITCGARHHTSRKGGPLVNSGPPFRFSRVSPGVHGLGRLNGSPVPAPESRITSAARSRISRPAPESRFWDRWVSGADRRLLSWRAWAWAQRLAMQRDVASGRAWHNICFR